MDGRQNDLTLSLAAEADKSVLYLDLEQTVQNLRTRNVPSLGPRNPAETLHRFWQMLAHNQGQMLNAAQLAGGLGNSGQTVARYLDIMVNLESFEWRAAFIQTYLERDTLPFRL